MTQQQPQDTQPSLEPTQAPPATQGPNGGPLPTMQPPIYHTPSPIALPTMTVSQPNS